LTVAWRSFILFSDAALKGQLFFLRKEVKKMSVEQEPQNSLSEKERTELLNSLADMKALRRTLEELVAAGEVNAEHTLEKALLGEVGRYQDDGFVEKARNLQDVCNALVLGFMQAEQIFQAAGVEMESEKKPIKPGRRSIFSFLRRGK